MSRIVDVEPLLKKYDRLNEGTEFSPIQFINDLMALEQCLYTEKEELLRVGKGAVKSRQGRFVIYDVEWFKEHFYSEEMIYGQPKQPSEDCVSREEALLALTGMDLPTDRDKLIALFTDRIQHLPPVTPTNADTREAYIKGYDYGVKDWFKSKTQPSEDCISRAEAIKEINKCHITSGVTNQGTWNECVDSIIRTIVDMPPVTPQRPKGNWIYNRTINNWVCSECNNTPKTLGYVGGADFMKEHFKYCNHCGAEMEGGLEDVDREERYS